MQAHVIKVDNPGSLEAALKKAKEVILSGGVVAIPTESFYGLAINAKDEQAIQRLLNVKKRGGDHPILILISSKAMLNRYVAHLPEKAHQLIREFWPGGLTIVFKAGPNISPLLTAGTGKIGIRLSSHPIPTKLAHATDSPITGTSANISGEPACMTAEEVSHALGEEVDLILDGGEAAGGKGSTVVDVTVDPPRILREGMVGEQELRDVLLSA
ncbi:MAG: L-threonylcarbamoyladenylate synthase [Desulfobacteraceae bacterium]|jgi:L-threonylcarbamoyladenylate synthase